MSAAPSRAPSIGGGSGQPLLPSFAETLADMIPRCLFCTAPLLADRCVHGDMHPDCCRDAREEGDDANYHLEFRDYECLG